MSRAGSNPRLVFAGILAVTTAVAFLPAPWRLGWQTEIARLVQVPLRPFTHMGNSIAAWLRPTPSPVAGVPAEARALVEELIEDRDLAHRRSLEALDRVRELEQIVADLQKLPAAAREADRIARVAHVSRRSPEHRDGPVEVTMPREAAAGLEPRAIAVFRGVHLLGRLTGERRGGVLTVLPLTARATGFIVVRIGASSVDPATWPTAQLEASGDGDLVGSVDAALAIGVGDEVFLDDDGWSGAARFMRVGTITAIRPDPEEPLRVQLVVEPAHRLRDLATIMLISDRVESEEAAP